MAEQWSEYVGSPTSCRHAVPRCEFTFRPTPRVLVRRQQQVLYWDVLLVFDFEGPRPFVVIRVPPGNVPLSTDYADSRFINFRECFKALSWGWMKHRDYERNQNG